MLAAYALRAARVVAFDNVSSFGAEPLDRCLTAGDTVEIRVLGRTEVPSLRWLATVMATGKISSSRATRRAGCSSRASSRPWKTPRELPAKGGDERAALSPFYRSRHSTILV